jgi:hypothetical protein
MHAILARAQNLVKLSIFTQILHKKTQDKFTSDASKLAEFGRKKKSQNCKTL